MHLPRMASTDYSLNEEHLMWPDPFDTLYLGDSYITPLDDSLDIFPDLGCPAVSTFYPTVPLPYSPSSPKPQQSPPKDAPPTMRRKRGRPRLDRSTSSTKSFQHHVRNVRLPHNQVERKYREGLNSELERLRRAVPTLPQSDEGASTGHIKPTKAMVLTSAIEYIHEIERQRDGLQEENTRLERGMWVMEGKVDE